MLTPTQIADEIARQIRALYPEEDCHRELCPEGFTRPCNLLVEGECQIDVNMGPQQVRLQPTYTITTYVDVDAYHHSHFDALHGRQMRLAALFLPGYLLVEETPGKRARAPKVLSLTTGGGYGFDTVTVIFDYAVDRAEFMAQATAPTAGDVRARLTINEKE